MPKKLTIIFFLLAAASCIYPKITIKGKGNVRLTQVDFASFSNWQAADHRKALTAFSESCKHIAKMPQNRSIGAQIGNITAADFRDVCEIAEVVKGMSNNQIKNFFENWFKPFLVATKSGESKGLFTGYYEADLRGSKIKSEKYKYPIYAKPKDLGSEPYLTRKEIEDGALKGKDLEILYVDDIADLFFLHVQGSGRVTLPNGAVVRLSFAAKNNQPYNSIGNYFADNKLIPRDKINADSIKEWMRANPDQSYEAMISNDSYIFFKVADAEYVIGAQGVPLTAEHSLAVDNDIIPYGSPLWVETFFKRNGAKEKYNQLLIAQDTGSAIRGVVRGDIFFGHGADAETKASSMASSGQYYILLPNNVVDKISRP